MLRKVLVVAAVLAGIAGCLSCVSNTSHFVYATIPTANQIAAFREDPNSGVLTQLYGSPYPVGDGAHSIVIHPSRQFLYVANPGEGANGEDDISLFEINTSNGGLTEAFPRTPLGSLATVPDLLVMDPSGNYLYVMNSGSNNISVFSIDATGTSCPTVGTTAANANPGCLTQVTGSPFNIGVLPLNMAVTPSGNFLYVSLASGPSCPSLGGGIAAFSISSGQLSLVDVTCSDGVNPYGLVINPSGSYVYAANTSSNSIAIFSIGSTGVLTEVLGSPINDGYSSPIWMTFDVSGNYLYVANEGSSNITAFSITSTGLPSALTTSTTNNAFGAENNPSFIAADPNGKFLFVGNQSPGRPAIQSFSISNGNLTILTLYGVGNSATSIAVLQ